MLVSLWKDDLFNRNWRDFGRVGIRGAFLIFSLCDAEKRDDVRCLPGGESIQSKTRSSSLLWSENSGMNSIGSLRAWDFAHARAS